MAYRVGVVGAGHISEFHLAALRGANGIVVEGLVDLDLERARQVAGRFGVAFVAPTLSDLLDKGVDVVHVLTPPESHARLALDALRAGCHVLVEKPAATDVSDLEAMARMADAKGRSLGVCHSLLFDPQVRRALEDVRAGKLGRLVSVDILRSSAYPPYPGGPLPAHYRDAGYPFRDIGIHCLYLIEAFLGPIQNVEASWRSLGGDPNLAFDEWRALVRCAQGTGQFQLSWNVRPLQNQMILQGTRGVRRVDLFLMSQGHRAALPLPRAAERVVNALTDSVVPLAYVPWNIARVVLKRARRYEGVQSYVAAFYAALSEGRRPPVSAWEALPVVDWTERIARAAERDFEGRLRGREAKSNEAPLLVTGASGGLGQVLLAGLKREDLGPLRILVRHAPRPPADDVEVVVGNLGDAETVERAVRGARWVFHVGAATKGAWEDHQCGTIEGTRNVIAACRKHAVEKLIYISSLSVLDWAGAPEFAPLVEDGPLEPQPEERGSYTRAKLEAERLVSAAAREGLPAIILRPGQLFGRTIPTLTPAVARPFRGYDLVLGDGELPLPLVYVDDVVDALILAARSALREGQVLHLVDEPTLTQNQLLAALGRDPKRIVRLPRPFVFAAGRLSEGLFGLLGRRSPFSAYRLRSALARRRFPSERAARALGWKPRVGVSEGLRRIGAADVEAPVHASSASST